MTIVTKPTRGKCITQHCRNWTCDESARGTWRQQVTLCAVYECALRPFRPTTNKPVPESVLDYYGVAEPEKSFFRSTDAAKTRFLSGNPVELMPRAAVRSD